MSFNQQATNCIHLLSINYVLCMCWQISIIAQKEFFYYLLVVGLSEMIKALFNDTQHCETEFTNPSEPALNMNVNVKTMSLCVWCFSCTFFLPLFNYSFPLLFQKSTIHQTNLF